MQNFDVGWWNRPPAKLGKYYKDVASKEYYDKLLDGKTSLRIERRNNKWENINIEMKDDNTPYVLIQGQEGVHTYYGGPRELGLYSFVTEVEIFVDSDLNIIGRTLKEEVNINDAPSSPPETLNTIFI